ncbi:hypothetical protein I3U56_04415 [Mycobacteroides abscessus subsp. abscessus]|uniref:hypothetical protein n=1 Tax=Mycobacteroides abscessus TaxID=36809 RepID=UPI0019D00BE3|nr:hypothetical protein [Mycobacteroides abscessus]MBN7489675.1 hypothetical protein [Mycobacteroides abscessus subsp. abscessus]
MTAYVIEFNRHTRARRVTEFGSPRSAMERRLILEADRVDPDVEIVALVGNLEALKKTHARYFGGSELDT